MAEPMRVGRGRRSLLRAAVATALLACGPGWASAVLGISYFGVSGFQSAGAAYVSTLNPYQSFAMSASDGAAVPVTDNFSANDWAQGSNRVAQSSYAQATGNTITFTDPSTQLATGGFNLAATAQHALIGPNTATGTAQHSGAFKLIDADGNDVAGNLTFEIYYDMSVARPAGSALGSYAEAVLSLQLAVDGVDYGGSQDFLRSTDLAGEAGSKSGFFSLSLMLGAGQYASYVLDGSAVSLALADRATTTVPEPGSLALAGAALAMLAASGRRRRPRAG